MSDRTPEQIVADLAPAYQEWKGGEKAKNKLKDEFFEAVTAYLAANETQAEDLLYIEAKSPEEAQEFAKKLRPGWIIEDWRDHPTEAGAYEVIVVEDPAFQPFTIEHDGKVWGRQITAGATFVDTDRLEVQDPELWREITEYPHRKLVEDVAYESGEDPSECEFEKDGFPDGWDGYIEWQLERHGYERQLTPLAELKPETLAKLQPYVFEGKPSVKLPAPKKAES